MRRDLIIGILASILLHGGALYGERIYVSIFGVTKQVVQRAKEKKELEVIEMPKLDEEPDPVEEIPTDVQAQVVEFAPPMQTDMPSVVTVDSFVQAVAPPPPEGLKPNPGVLTIPQNRSGGLQTKLTNVFNLADLDQKPQERYKANPQYPFEMRRAGIEGEVTVGFIVNSSGDVQDAYVVKSSQREFEPPAIQAVMKWKFRPGKKGGKAVNTRMLIPIVFSITEE